jgi:hypothetical protein
MHTDAIFTMKQEDLLETQNAFLKVEKKKTELIL